MSMIKDKAKSTLKHFTPPIIWDGVTRFRSLLLHSDAGPRVVMPAQDRHGIERDANWYDENFPESMRQHYSLSRYYPFWAVIVDRALRYGANSVLDIGCGAGQFAALLYDKGLRTYCGLDFSRKRVEYARLVCPDYTFVVADALETDLYGTLRYDTVICTEFLEHVDRDLEVISRVQKGVRFLASVPDFLSASHVRCFVDRDEVLERYCPYLSPCSVDSFLIGKHTYHIIDGVRA